MYWEKIKCNIEENIMDLLDDTRNSDEKKMLENAEELTKQQIELDAVALEKQKLIDEMNELKGIKTKEKKSLNNNSPK